MLTKTASTLLNLGASRVLRSQDPPADAAASLGLLVVFLVLGLVPALAQVDLTGVWVAQYHEDQPERIPGPELGDYLGLPINAPARLRADSWDADLLTRPEYQCRPHPYDYGDRHSHVSLGKWEGDMLTITTTHLKESYIRRNGVPRSEKAPITEHFLRHENYLTMARDGAETMYPENRLKMNKPNPAVRATAKVTAWIDNVNRVA